LAAGHVRIDDLHGNVHLVVRELPRHLSQRVQESFRGAQCIYVDYLVLAALFRTCITFYALTEHFYE
jgi:hypothetical protein